MIQYNVTSSVQQYVNNFVHTIFMTNKGHIGVHLSLDQPFDCD